MHARSRRWRVLGTCAGTAVEGLAELPRGGPIGSSTTRGGGGCPFRRVSWEGWDGVGRGRGAEVWAGGGIACRQAARMVTGLERGGKIGRKMPHGSQERNLIVASSTRARRQDWRAQSDGKEHSTGRLNHSVRGQDASTTRLERGTEGAGAVQARRWRTEEGPRYPWARGRRKVSTARMANGPLVGGHPARDRKAGETHRSGGGEKSSKSARPLWDGRPGGRHAKEQR